MSTSVYLDDVLVASRTLEEHEVHVRQVLTLLQRNGLAINEKKCVWAQQQVRYLGQSVSAEGIAPLSQRIQDIIAAPRPTTKVEMQRYLGMVNFYHRFLPNIAEVLAPLHALASVAKSPKSPLDWSSGRGVQLAREES